MPMPTSNARTAYGLLNAIARIVSDVPERLDMSRVCYRGDALESWARMSDAPVPDCLTVGCIAGWTLVLTGHTREHEQNPDDTVPAQIVLGLSQLGQAHELFYPEALVGGPSGERQTRQHALDTVAHIRAFQRKYKTQLQATPITIASEFQAGE